MRTASPSSFVMRDTPPVPAPTPLTPAFVPDAARRADDVNGDPADVPSPELVRLLAHLRSSVAHHVAERRAAGATLERVIPEMRCLVREAESCEGWHDASNTLLTQVVRWGIEAYYDEPELQHVPRFY